MNHLFHKQRRSKNFLHKPIQAKSLGKNLLCFALPRENVGVRMRDQVKGLNLLGRGGGEEDG